MIIGDKFCDGLCDGGVCITRECRYDYNRGQPGQTVVSAIETWSVEEGRVRGLAFSKTLSQDGTTMALHSEYRPPSGLRSGLVKIWKYSSDRKICSQLGKDIDVADGFGSGVSLSANGSRIMVPEYDYDGDKWKMQNAGIRIQGIVRR